jgi:hypothetical protein
MNKPKPRVKVDSTPASGQQTPKDDGKGKKEEVVEEMDVEDDGSGPKIEEMDVD